MSKQLSRLLLALTAFAWSCSNPVSEPDPVRSPITASHPPPNPIPTVGANDDPPVEVVLTITRRSLDGFPFVDWGFRNQMDQPIIMVLPNFQCNSPSDGFTSWSAAVEEEDGSYDYVIDPIVPGGTWVYRDFLVGDPYRNSLLLFGDCEDRKLELFVLRTDEEERPYMEGEVYQPYTHVRFVDQGG